LRIRAEAEAGQAGDVTMQIRTGPTPLAGASGWSSWKSFTGEVAVLDKPADRYVEIQVELTTGDPLKSPRLKQVVIEASPQPASDWTASVRVLEHDNAKIVRTSIPFKYEPLDHASLRELRTKYKLDEVVKGAKDEFELITRLAAWSAKLWEKGHLREDYPPWNALKILKNHGDGTPVGGFCQQYNVVFLQAWGPRERHSRWA
jgi:hypothetical protein